MKTHNYWAIMDFDDTLGGVVIDGKVCPNTAAYMDARKRFLAVMKREGIDVVAAEEECIKKEAIEHDRHGFKDIGLFANSLAYAYKKLVGKERDKAVIDEVLDIGMSVFTDYPYVALPGAVPTLQVLGEHLNIAVVTKGPDEVQVEKMLKSGIIPYVDSYFILNHKNDEEWAKVLAALGINEMDKLHSWAIGNSVKADINPPLRFGLHGIHVSVDVDWEYEFEEIEDPAPLRSVHEVPSIGDVLKIIDLIEE